MWIGRASIVMVGVAVWLLAPACAKVPAAPDAGRRSEWDSAGAGLAPLSTPCTVDAAKALVITLKDGETALVGLDATRTELRVNDIACVAGTAPKVSSLSGLKVLAGRAAKDAVLGARVLLDFTAPFLTGSSTASRIAVELGGPNDELWVRLGTKDDVVAFQPDGASTTAAYVSLTAATRDIDVKGAGRAAIFLGAGNDTFRGAVALPLRVYGEEGNDQLTTAGGADLLDGDVGADGITSGPGDDVLVGGGGADVLNGQGGCDSYLGGDGVDTVRDDVEAYSWMDGVEINAALLAGACTRDGGNESACPLGFRRDETGLCAPQRSGDGALPGAAADGSLLDVDAGPDLSANVGETVTLVGDARADVVAVWWTQVSGPPVILAATDLRRTNFPAPAYSGSGHATVLLMLQASDGQRIESDLVAVALNRPPSPPVVTVSSAVQTTAPLDCTVTSSDPDGDPVVYSYSWTRNGTAASTESRIPAASLAAGDLWSCSGAVSDQRAQVAADMPVVVRVGCGNGVVDASETCDDGNLVGTDGCDALCSDVNECLGAPGCKPNSACVNTIGGFRCDCRDGFRGDGKIACTAINCAAGQYWSGTACTGCAAGTWSSGGSVKTCTAINCPKDQYWSSEFCLSCGPGRWSDGGPATSCNAIACPVNQYFDQTATPRVCKPCPTGLVSSGGTSTSCAPPGANCPKNTYWSLSNPATLAGSCLACSPGTWSAGGGVSACQNIDCPVNYIWDANQSLCVSCPRGFVSRGGYVRGCNSVRWETGNYLVSGDSKSVVDKVTMLEWQRSVTSSTYSLQGARDYCAGLNLGGGDGWRVPTIEELASTLDTARSPPFDTNFIGYVDALVWSSTPSGSNSASTMYLRTGASSTVRVDAATNVRCVRSNCDYPTPSATMGCADAVCPTGSVWTGTTCESCPSGQWSFGGRLTKCLPALCPQYTRWTGTANECTACDAGFTSPGGDVMTCSKVSCQANTYWDGGACAPCATGLFSPGGDIVRCSPYLPPSHQVDASVKIITDPTSTHIWQRYPPVSLYNWNAAFDYCKALDIDGTIGWRLPTLQELRTLVVAGNPSIDTAAFPATGSSDYWTSTVAASNTNYAWHVYFGNGNGYADQPMTNSMKVRCVR